METLYRGGSTDGSLRTYDSNTTVESVREPNHSFEVAEATRLGSIEKAIILKEITRMAVYKIRMGKEPWVFYSGKMLCEKFPYMAQRSIERWMRELEEAGELISCIRNKMRYDKTKSYTIPHFESIHAQNGESNAQDGEPIPPLSTPNTNTSAVKPREYVGETEKQDKTPKAKYPHSKEVFRWFAKPEKSWNLNTTELAHAELLWERGKAEVEKYLRYVVAHKDDDRFYQITKPSDLERKWEDIKAYARRTQ